MHNPLASACCPRRPQPGLLASYRPTLFIDKAVDAGGDPRAASPSSTSTVLHAPVERPYPWHQMFGQSGQGNQSPATPSRGPPSSTATARSDAGGEEAHRAQDLRIYDSGIDMADQMVGRMVAELKRSGPGQHHRHLLSDHGEEHYERASRSSPTDRTTVSSYGDGQHRVVWAIRTPDNARAGTSIKETVRLFDLVPTIMEST